MFAGVAVAVVHAFIIAVVVVVVVVAAAVTAFMVDSISVVVCC
jgi:hypothetical protein